MCLSVMFGQTCPRVNTTIEGERLKILIHKSNKKFFGGIRLGDDIFIMLNFKLTNKFFLSKGIFHDK